MAARAAVPIRKIPLYIDKGLLVLNKPPGIICQFHISDKTQQVGEDSDFREFLDDTRHHLRLEDELLPIHRLDKNTTGVLALARSPNHAKTVAQQFQSRTVEKTYLALVRGGAKSFAERSGTVRGALTYVDGRLVPDGARINSGGKTVRKIAETDWEVLVSSPLAPVSLLKLNPFTGYKHQLRFQLAHSLKTPVLGDILYSRSPLSSTITQIATVPSDCMYLHSSRLSLLRYRKTGESKRVRVAVGAPLPGYFTRLCAKLKIPLDADAVTGGLWVDGQRAPLSSSADQLPELTESEDVAARREGWLDDATYKLAGIKGRWLGH